MTALLSFISIGLTILIVGVILYTYIARGHDLLSWRNFILLGFIQFYGITVAVAAPLDFPSEIYRPTGEGYGPLAMSMPMFVGVFLLCWKMGMGWASADRAFPRLNIPVTNTGLLIAIAILTLVALTGLVLRGGAIGEAILLFMRFSWGAAAAGLATYLLLTNLRSPLYWAVFIGVFGTVAVTSTVGTIDRRNFLSVFFVVPWVWYFVSLRYQAPRKVLQMMVVAAGVTLVFLAAYNSQRMRLYEGEAQTFTQRFSQITSALTEGSSAGKDNLLRDLLFQDAPLNTLLIMENYPDPYPYLPFHGVHVFAVNPIPRVLYPSKPVALGMLLQEQLKIQANLGPGVIGHGWAEMGIVGVFYYAVILGVMAGLMDRIVRSRADNPWLLVAAGCNLGNILGVPRGETSIFLVMTFVGLVTLLVGFPVIFQVFKPYFLAGKDVYIPPPPTAEELEEEALAQSQGLDDSGSAEGSGDGAGPQRPDGDGGIDPFPGLGDGGGLVPLRRGAAGIGGGDPAWRDARFVPVSATLPAPMPATPAGVMLPNGDRADRLADGVLERGVLDVPLSTSAADAHGGNGGNGGHGANGLNGKNRTNGTNGEPAHGGHGANGTNGSHGTGVEPAPGFVRAVPPSPMNGDAPGGAPGPGSAG